MKKTDNRIAYLRKQAGYTQKSLAEALHITDKAVSKWERGLSFPDVSILPKLSLLLDVDISLLLSAEDHHHKGWMGVVDLQNCDIDLRQKVYDKPLVYFLLVHFLLADVQNVCFLCSAENKKFLQQELFSTLGFTFTFSLEDVSGNDLMILCNPVFLFGADLTRHFQGAMVSKTVTTLVPEYAAAPFLFCPSEYSALYPQKTDCLLDMSTPRSLGRGMVCLKLDDVDALTDASNFVRLYQKQTGMLIGSLEEIAYKKGIISKEILQQLAENVTYGALLQAIADSLPM